MGVQALTAKLREDTLQQYLQGVFPRDSAQNARFSINFFTSIGLGVLSEDLRKFYMDAPKLLLEKKYAELLSKANMDSSSSSDDSSSSSSSSSSERDRRRRRRR